MKNCIIEIRAGVGGLDAAGFAEDLFKMYSKFAASKGWLLEVSDSSETNTGYSKIIFSLNSNSDDIYSFMQRESGVHCVQRLSGNGKNRRMHTSTVSVVVLPQIEEASFEIKEGDLRIERYRASGKGGQHRNVTDSAVRITHIPTGLVAQSCGERDQHKNKKSAMSVLRSRLFDSIEEEKNSSVNKERQEQAGRCNRSEKIRTYNFPENRVTDHKLNIKIFQLEKIMRGELALIEKKK